MLPVGSLAEHDSDYWIKGIGAVAAFGFVTGIISWVAHAVWRVVVLDLESDANDWFNYGCRLGGTLALAYLLIDALS